MSACYKALAINPRWQAGNSYKNNIIPSSISNLIINEGSLTKSLMKLSNGNFEVRVLNEKIAKPYFHEQRKLFQPLQHWALIRQVELTIYGEAVVFARSIIPLSLIIKGKKGLANLGQKPLGHLLFNKGKVNVSEREFTERDYQKEKIYARRTPYEYMGSTVLVSEYFLPSLEKYVDLK